MNSFDVFVIKGFTVEGYIKDMYPLMITNVVASYKSIKVNKVKQNLHYFYSLVKMCYLMGLLSWLGFPLSTTPVSLAETCTCTPQ